MPRQIGSNFFRFNLRLPFTLPDLNGMAHFWDRKDCEQLKSKAAEMSEDQDLLKRVASGDKAAMGVLFERYQRPLYAFLRNRGADVQSADDAVQDAMLNVWRTAGRYSGTASVKTWLFTIGRNKLIDRLRKNAKLRFVDEVPEGIDDAPDAEAVLISSGDAARVQACLEKLKPMHLSIMRLAFFEDLTYPEISSLEDIPEGTVKTRAYHAK
jgi:RNA polymerase sigma-70 factor (ECF subfamily)